MLHPDRTVTIRCPVEAGGDALSEAIPGAPTEITRLARRLDRGGREREVTDVQVGEHTVTFRMRIPGLEAVTTKCEIVDERGVAWDIESINEQTSPPRRFFLFNCTARE